MMHIRMFLARTPPAFYALLLATGFAICGCAHPTSPRSDGVFADLSGFHGPVYIRGYSITMPEFDLGTAQQAEYQLNDVRDIGKKCGIYLAIIPRDGKIVDETANYNGRLQLELKDSKGISVVSVDGRLGEYIWAQGGNCELYQLDKSFFDPDPNEKYTLRLTYSPDSKLNGMRGFVYVRSGGSK